MSEPINSLHLHVETTDEGEVAEPYPQALALALPELIAKHGGRLHTMLCEDGMVCFKPAGQLDYRSVTSYMQGGKECLFQLHDAQAKCGFNSVVWPEQGAFTAMTERYPGLPSMIGMQAWGLASGVRTTSKKKR